MGCYNDVINSLFNTSMIVIILLIFVSLSAEVTNLFNLVICAFNMVDYETWQEQGAICRGEGGTSPSLALVIPPLERLQTSQAGMHCFPTTGSTTKFTYHRSNFKLNMQQKAFGGRASPGPTSGPEAHPDVQCAVDVDSSRPWKGTPRPSSRS